MRQEGCGKDKTVRNREIRRSVEGRGMGMWNIGNRRWTLQGLSGRKAGNLKEVGLLTHNTSSTKSGAKCSLQQSTTDRFDLCYKTGICNNVLQK